MFDSVCANVVWSLTK